MSESTINPLTRADLEGAAYLCLREAAFTDLDQPAPVSGEFIRREHHRRKIRFDQALAKMNEGAASLVELGLSPEDCTWAATMAHLAKDPAGWSTRFQAAASALQPEA